MSIIILNRLELVKILREIAATEGCHLSLRAASKIANWLKEETAYNITTWLQKVEEQRTEIRLRSTVTNKMGGGYE